MKSLQQTTQGRKYLSSILKNQMVFTEKDLRSATLFASKGEFLEK